MSARSKAQEVLENYRRAGVIAENALVLARKIVKPGANAYKIAQKLEGFIRDQGALPSFPVNFSITNEAAHYSPEILDTRTVGKNDTIKVDLGAHIDGYIVDTAITINFNKEADALTEVSKEALDNAIDNVKAGVSVNHIGEIVEKTIVSAGFQPVRNLSGHQIKRNVLHAGVSIPNHGPGYFKLKDYKFQKGGVYAIEPFASTGPGEITNGKRTNIFRIVKKPKKGEVEQAKLIKKFLPIVGVLPFSPRFVYDESTGEKGASVVNKEIRKLLRSGHIMGYPVLVEVDKQANVSQHEHTILVKQNGCEVFTQN